MKLNELSKDDASLVQSGLKALGFYHGTTRGIPGPKTNVAYLNYINRRENTQGGFSEFFAKRAESQIGQRESGNNGGAAVRKYQGATWYAPGEWAWCAAFVCWCFQKAQEDSPIAMERPTTPGAWAFEKWARKAGAELIKPASETEVRRGDIVIYTFSHIGIAVADESDGRVDTVEGNTNKAGSREGDGVYKKSRKKSQIRSIIRL
jgi:hypothetical protein